MSTSRSRRSFTGRSGLLRRHCRGDCNRSADCALLAAEAAAHAPAIHRSPRSTERPSACATTCCTSVGCCVEQCTRRRRLPAARHGDLSFQIKLILAALHEAAAELVRGRGQRLPQGTGRRFPRQVHRRHHVGLPACASRIVRTGAAARSAEILWHGPPRAPRRIARVGDDREHRLTQELQRAARRAVTAGDRGQDRVVVHDGPHWFSPGMSAAQITSTTPGRARSLSSAMPFRRPCATGDRPSAACSVPASSGRSSM